MSGPGERVYLYGVAAPACLRGPGPRGLDGSRVRTLSHDGIAAIVGGYRGVDFRDLPRETLLRCLLTHQRVLERTVEEGGVVPLEFGTLFERYPDVEEVLAHCHDQLRTYVALLQGKVEVEVAATWDTSWALQEVAREEMIARARETISRRGPATVEERAGLGRLVKASLDRRRDHYRDRVLEALRPVALESATNALISDQMVLNVAFLVERERRPELEARAGELDAAFEGRIDLRLIGPMPPYTFGTVRVSRLRSEAVSAARMALGLEGPLTPAAVRRSYRLLAAGAQRGEGEGPARLAELRAARDTLTSACACACEPAIAGDRWLASIRRAPAGDVEPARFGGPG